MTVKKLRLRVVHGDMLPVYDADKEQAVFFTVEDEQTVVEKVT